MKKLPVWIEREGGLAFSCTRCGGCCRGFAGYVWVSEPEIVALAAHLGLSLGDFGRRYLRRVDTRISLMEKKNHDCVFWDDDRGCTVYAARPSQCRTYPFWSQVVKTRKAWREEAARCPGIALAPAPAPADAPVRRFAPAEIARLLAGEGEA
jgi:Fe-S-cluster containining protein